jgi:hypothetical protein
MFKIWYLYNTIHQKSFLLHSVQVVFISMTDRQTHGSNLASVPFPKQYAKSRAMLFQESENSFCPIGCGMDEIAMHHLGCTTLPASDLRLLNRWMSHKNTDPPIQLAIMRGLKEWILVEPIP